jgi:hypothetical protein
MAYSAVLVLLFPCSAYLSNDYQHCVEYERFWFGWPHEDISTCSLADKPVNSDA